MAAISAASPSPARASAAARPATQRTSGLSSAAACHSRRARAGSPSASNIAPTATCATAASTDDATSSRPRRSATAGSRENAAAIAPAMSRRCLGRGRVYSHGRRLGVHRACRRRRSGIRRCRSTCNRVGNRHELLAVGRIGHGTERRAHGRRTRTIERSIGRDHQALAIARRRGRSGHGLVTPEQARDDRTRVRWKLRLDRREIDTCGDRWSPRGRAMERRGERDFDPRCGIGGICRAAERHRERVGRREHHVTRSACDESTALWTDQLGLRRRWEIARRPPPERRQIRGLERGIARWWRRVVPRRQLAYAARFAPFAHNHAPKSRDRGRRVRLRTAPTDGRARRTASSATRDGPRAHRSVDVTQLRERDRNVRELVVVGRDGHAELSRVIEIGERRGRTAHGAQAAARDEQASEPRAIVVVPARPDRAAERSTASSCSIASPAALRSSSRRARAAPRRLADRRGSGSGDRDAPRPARAARPARRHRSASAHARRSRRPRA